MNINSMSCRISIPSSISHPQDNNIILEPVGRNTAPAIALGIKYCMEKLGAAKDEVLFISPADHIIKPAERFAEYVRHSEEISEKGYIVTFGIKPTRPETGYGYIKARNKERTPESHGYYLGRDDLPKNPILRLPGIMSMKGITTGIPECSPSASTR